MIETFSIYFFVTAAVGVVLFLMIFLRGRANERTRFNMALLVIVVQEVLNDEREPSTSKERKKTRKGRGLHQKQQTDNVR
jgi:NhaP-type Na+/H+ and K+/H+ antiporter